MVGFPYEYGDNLTTNEAFENLKGHSKEVAMTLVWFVLSSNSVIAKDVAPKPGQKETKDVLSTALGANKGVAGFLAGMMCLGLITSFTGPAAMFVAGAFCAGTLSYFLKR